VTPVAKFDEETEIKGKPITVQAPYMPFKDIWQLTVNYKEEGSIAVEGQPVFTFHGLNFTKEIQLQRSEDDGEFLMVDHSTAGGNTNQSITDTQPVYGKKIKYKVVAFESDDFENGEG